MKDNAGQKLIRKETNQKFLIKKSKGFCKKRNSMFFERAYELKGPHPSLDLIVRQSELDELFEPLN